MTELNSGLAAGFKLSYQPLNDFGSATRTPDSDDNLLFTHASSSPLRDHAWEGGLVVRLRLDQIEFTNWLEGLGSIVLIPALIRAVSTRTFLDLMFGRIILLSYFDPSRFLTKCRAEGIKAGFVSRRWTNRLRTAQGWKAHEYPIFQGRALGHIAGGLPFVLGSARLHQMVFNWVYPLSLVQELVGAAGQMEQIKSGLKHGRRGFTEDDLED